MKEKIKKTARLFAIMVIFTICVVGYFGDNLALMLVGAFAGYWVLASILTDKKDDTKEIDIIE